MRRLTASGPPTIRYSTSVAVLSDTMIIIVMQVLDGHHGARIEPLDRAGAGL